MKCNEQAADFGNIHFHMMSLLYKWKPGNVQSSDFYPYTWWAQLVLSEK